MFIFSIQIQDYGDFYLASQIFHLHIFLSCGLMLLVFFSQLEVGAHKPSASLFPRMSSTLSPISFPIPKPTNHLCFHPEHRTGVTGVQAGKLKQNLGLRNLCSRVCRHLIWKCPHVFSLIQVSVAARLIPDPLSGRSIVIASVLRGFLAQWEEHSIGDKESVFIISNPQVIL